MAFGVKKFSIALGFFVGGHDVSGDSLSSPIAVRPLDRAGGHDFVIELLEKVRRERVQADGEFSVPLFSPPE